MKRRETKGVVKDRLSGLMPDAARLSAVSRSPLVRAGSRWVSFARGLSRGRRLAAADTPAFIESLYGGKFSSAEGGAFALDKVYRTTGGGRFVSETRLSLSVHPRFDLRLSSVAVTHAGSRLHQGAAPMTTLLTRVVTGGRDRRVDTSHVTNFVVTPPPGWQTRDVSPTSVERVTSSFGYVNARGRRTQQAQAHEPARVERVAREVWLKGDETARPTFTPAPASQQLTSQDLRHFVTHAPRQEFVSLLLNTYLPAVSREVLSLRTVGDVSGITASRAASRGETAWRFAHAAGAPMRLPAARTYAAPRQVPAGAVEIVRESHSAETSKVYTPLREYATARGAQAPFLHVLPPAALLSSLSETSPTFLTNVVGRAVYQMSGYAPAPSPQLLRTHTTSTGAREGIHEPRLLGTTTPSRTTVTTVTSDVLSSLHTFVGRVYTNVAGDAQAGGSLLFTRTGFEPTPRGDLEKVQSRRRGGSVETTSINTTLRNLFARSFEFVRLNSGAEFAREASAQGAGAQVERGRARGVFTTQSVPGAGTFLFVTGLRRRAAGASDAVALSPTAATAVHLTKAVGHERAPRETRAARPEGLALELIRHRREQLLQPPRPGYVFTQAPRAQLEERQVITKASREEIVEVVRKEVRLLTSSAPAPAAVSRAELAGLAEEVYSTLARRLLVEKERLGRF